MSYSTSSPPSLTSSALSGTAQVWSYSTTDAYTTVRVTGYFSNAKNLGMLKGDRVYVTKSDASPISTQIGIVSAINADGSADLSDGIAVTATNSD